MPHASKVSFQTLANGQSVPAIQGQLYCSSRDASKEAIGWLQHQKLSGQNGSPFCLLGLGAGFHLNLLLEETDLPKIQVVEFHPELIELWLSQNSHLQNRVVFSPEASEVSPVVLEFRPAWNGNIKFYHELSQKLRRATAFHLREEAELHGCWILSEALQSHSNNFEITVKDIAHSFPLENQTEEAKIWRTLREFVK